MSDVLRINSHLAIPLHEIEMTFATSGGPGGQHANRAATRVDARFDVERSTVLGPRQRQRILSALGPVVRVTASDRRSQAQNREVALERLAARLASALTVEKPRVPTKPARRAKQRRVDNKRRRGEVKRLRGRPPGDDA